MMKVHELIAALGHGNEREREHLINAAKFDLGPISAVKALANVSTTGFIEEIPAEMCAFQVDLADGRIAIALARRGQVFVEMPDEAWVLWHMWVRSAGSAWTRANLQIVLPGKWRGGVLA